MSGLDYKKGVKIKITPLSPIHIGTGVDVDRAELSIHDNIFYRSSLFDLIKIGGRNAQELIQTAIDRPTHPVPALQEIVRDSYQYRMVTDRSINQPTLDFKEHIKTNGMMYIPGSSIKGAILTAIISEAVRDTSFDQSYYNFYEKLFTGRFNRWRDNQLLFRIGILWLQYNRKLVNKIENPWDIQKNRRYNREHFSKWLMVRDSDGSDPSKAGVLRRLMRRGTPQPIPDIMVETIRHDGREFFSEIALHKSIPVEVDELLDIIHSHYKKTYEIEREWLEYRNINGVDVVNNKNDVTLFRVGFGSGLLNTSVVPVIDDLGKNILQKFAKRNKLTRSGATKPNTKWMAPTAKKTDQSFYPLGWAKIEIQE